MRAIRRDLRANVKEIVVGTSQMFDWKNYVRSFPWATIATAAVIGYLLVPRRREAALPLETKESLENLTKEVKAAVAPPPREPSFSLVKLVWPVLSTVVLRVGTSYLTQLATSLLDLQNQGGPSPSNRPGAGPAGADQGMSVSRPVKVRK